MQCFTPVAVEAGMGDVSKFYNSIRREFYLGAGDREHD